jgi:hypothetical protein
MQSTKSINLNLLTATRGDEVEQVEAGIRGGSKCVLWTAELRPATRGGKCGVSPADRSA